ncbi:MAG: hypothetical protein R3212_02345 [Xanthomonadales bacterium]|nr:hypothetical protein [Xanthomonadales bacterium]
MRKKGRFTDILIGIVVMYVFLGVGIVTVQVLSGAKCGPVRLGGEYVYSVNANASRFWLWRTFEWLPTFWDNVVDRDMPVIDYIAPRECLWVPDGKTAAQVLEEVEAARARRQGQ